MEVQTTTPNQRKKERKKKKSIAGQTHVLGLVGRKHLKTYWP
jgi:hypothetical protein